MPIFEFRCKNCAKISEKICNSQLVAIECPDCGTEATRIVSIFSGQTDSSTLPSGGCQPGSGFT